MLWSNQVVYLEYSGAFSYRQIGYYCLYNIIAFFIFSYCHFYRSKFTLSIQKVKT